MELRSEPGAEEFAIHDYDEFGALHLGEYEQIGDVVSVAQLIARHGEAYAAYVNDVGMDDANEDDFTERYVGHYPTVETYVDAAISDWGWNEELDRLRETSPIGSHLTIDYTALAEAVRIEWDVIERPDSSVDIFSPQ